MPNMTKNKKKPEPTPLYTYEIMRIKTQCAWCLRPFYPGESAAVAEGRTFCDRVHLRLWRKQR